MPDTKYFAVCTPLGKLCPNEYPISSDWDKDIMEEEERKDQDKEDNFSVCSYWDADFKEQEKKNQEKEDQKDNDRKTPQTGPKSSSVDTFTPQPYKSSTISYATIQVYHKWWKLKI